MANTNETRAILENEFITAWANETQIAYDNVNFDDNQSGLEEYVEIRFIVYQNENAATGDTFTRLEGALVIAIYTKYGTGSGRAYELSDLVDTYMTNKCFGDVTTRVTDPRRNGDTKEGWFSVLASIPFISDDCRV